MSDSTDTPPVFDNSRLADWLIATVNPSIADLTVGRMGGGNSSGAWKLDFRTADGPANLVLKTTTESGLVFDCDASREGRIIKAAKQVGAPLPSIVAIDDTGAVLGQPCFVMELVDGRTVPESTPASFHGDGWFRDASAEVQQAVWWSFIDRLAQLHSVDTDSVPAHYVESGVVDMLNYWRRSLLDAAPTELVPRQLAVIDWLATHIPDDANDKPALCMGDARLGNALLNGNEATTLVDFEVAYIGNPAADIGYCLMQESFTRLLTDRPATGLPSPEQTWDRWEQLTRRTTRDREYWTAFGATILCVTGTRAMLKWGVPVEAVESANIVVQEWEALIERAAH
ncbi:phosphotransferase family protein [Mycobacterium sp. OTB74]|uniref:phosphotransferase family protein n=1 Tax=Mycobacterium sp. OTB74 TaxID=1853452 RepID=UPI0024769D95|nr:phosphotransferase family protein [Mycobacterium sp. OTB74]MDH6243999.1 aminoglycoside phosphotransferase (APT) family kinase protein [Mycobacterium sp. OTB74]